MLKLIGIGFVTWAMFYLGIAQLILLFTANILLWGAAL
jgi:hypothetical protein